MSESRGESQSPNASGSASIHYSLEQLRIIAHRAGHLQVIACAGSGKTETIAKRVASLLAEGVEPRAIVAFTFTNAAAAALKSRILRKVQEQEPGRSLDRLSPMFVGTIHAFCQRFLTEQVPRFATFELFNAHRLVGLLTREYHALGLDTLGIPGRTEAVEAFIKTADAVENEMIPPSALPVGAFRTVYENYLATLDRYHVLTFNQAIARAVEELEKPDVFARYHATLRHLVVDEFQDINPAQARLIRLMGRDPVHVTVVGDDDQAIYQWRGSSVNFIRDFSDEYGAHRETLGVNRRSRAGIVDTAAHFAGTIPHRLPKVISASREDHPRSVVRFVAPDAAAEAAQIADALVEMHLRGVAWRDMALLLRAMPSSKPFLEAFDARQIPYRCEGRSALLLQGDALALAQILAWLAGRQDFWDPRIRQKVPLTLDGVVSHAQQQFDLPATRVDFLRKMLPVLQVAMPEMEEADLVGLFYRLLNAFGVAEWDDTDPGVIRRLGTLGRFSELLADYESVSRRARKLLDRSSGRRVVASGRAGGERFLDQLVHYISFYAQDAYRDFSGEPDHEGDSVTVSTVHAAKGLEWPVVFVPCLTSKRFPSMYAGKQEDWLVPRDVFPASRYEGGDDDERRLFYVAMTRARDHLFVSSHAKVTKQAAAPSPYFLDVGGGAIKPGGAVPWLPDAVPPHGGGADDKPTFSFSQLAQFGTCPLQYRLRTNLGFQPSSAKEMGYGNAVHHLMRRVAEHVRAFGAGPTSGDLDKLFDREFYLPYADQPAWERMEERARSLVEAYLRDFPDDLQRVWEVERPFELHLAHANVSGRADVILDRQDGVEGTLAIVDYKTRRVVDNDATMDLQLKAYAAAARGEGHEVRAAWLHDLTADKDHARHAVQTAAPLVSAATAALDGMAQGIRARKFLPVAGKHCRICDVRLLCRHAGG
jgi:DNA helicase-2/ATP-dependent DNA helicase PcrA